MNKNFLTYKLIIVVLLFARCVKPYTPPALEAKNNYVVVDGFINTGANQITTITLTRTRNLTDTFTILPEPNASVIIQSSDGTTYPLTESRLGVYQSRPLNLSNANTYQLQIFTSDRKQYSSEYVECKQTAPIDSLTWEQQNDVTIYLYAHDPANSTHYYKWDYTETWQYNSELQGIYVLSGNLTVVADSTNQIDSCWQGDESKEILLGSSVTLSEDVISHAKIAVIPQGDKRIDYRYSILVKQRAITAEAYSYWQIVQKNSQDRGGFFDLQPGQLVGNIHCNSDPTEPVIGYINASTEQDYRIFISHREVEDWTLGGGDCPTITISQNPVDYRIYDYPDPLYAPYYFATGGGLVLAKKVCLDCRLHGGTNERPTYW
jgi:hypothetical protein